MQTVAEIAVRFTAEGWHCWPEAPDHRAYLRDKHRHIFFVEVRMGVTHHEREVEFHDLLAECIPVFGRGDFGQASCETLATRLLHYLAHHYPHRPISVAVFEDNEAGAVVRNLDTSDM
jgi:hypothetical protein